MFTLSELDQAAALVHRHVPPTPQHAWALLAERLGTGIWVKHENHTPLGAFKVRGGVTYLTALREREPALTGILSSSSGNHGQSLARASRALGMHCTIVVRRDNNPEKNAAMRALGAELVEYGADSQETLDHAETLAAERGLHLVPPWHPDLVRGVASYSLEFLRGVPELDVVYVPIGLGSGICGMMAARDALGARTRIIGVVPEQANTYERSFAAGRPVPTNRCDTIADGLGLKRPHPEALALILKGVDRIVAVSDAAMAEAVGIYLTDTHNLAEPSGAATLAAALQERDGLRGKAVGVVLSGGNVDSRFLARLLAAGAP